MHNLLFMGLGAPELILIAFVIVLLFGAKKIPDLMKSLGRGVKSFKEGMNEESPATTDEEVDKREPAKKDSPSQKEKTDNDKEDPTV